MRALPSRPRTIDDRPSPVQTTFDASDEDITDTLNGEPDTCWPLHSTVSRYAPKYNIPSSPCESMLCRTTYPRAYLELLKKIWYISQKIHHWILSNCCVIPAMFNSPPYYRRRWYPHQQQPQLEMLTFGPRVVSVMLSWTCNVSICILRKIVWNNSSSLDGDVTCQRYS